MSTLYIMIPAALALAIGALIAFIWAARTGQFDDPDSQAYRMLFDDEPKRDPTDAHDDSQD